jgi:hypothetical protein
MGDRIWSVQLNLDDVAADMDAFPTDSEQAAWVRGFRLGARGLPLRVGQSEAWQAGHRQGADAYLRVAELRDRQSAKGHASAAARATKPQPRFNHGSTTVEEQPPGAVVSPPVGDPPTEYPPESNRGSTAVQPESNRSPTGGQPQSKIENRESRIENPGTNARPPDPPETEPPEHLDPKARWPYERGMPWAVAIQAFGGKIGDGNWLAWKTLAEKYPPAVLARAAATVPADQRWSDRVEMAIKTLPVATRRVIDVKREPTPEEREARRAAVAELAKRTGLQPAGVS